MLSKKPCYESYSATLKTLLIEALSHGYYWASLRVSERDDDGDLQTAYYYAPLVALVGKLKDEARYGRLDLFVDWEYHPTKAFITNCHTKKVEMILHQDRNEVAYAIEKKIKARCNRLIFDNRQEAVAALVPRQPDPDSSGYFDLGGDWEGTNYYE